jgi:hypothetical protein
MLQRGKQYHLRAGTTGLSRGVIGLAFSWIKNIGCFKIRYLDS